MPHYHSPHSFIYIIANKFNEEIYNNVQIHLLHVEDNIGFEKFCHFFSKKKKKKEMI